MKNFIGTEKVKKRVQVAGGVIIREDVDGNQQVLIIKRSPDDHWPNHWEFPRGKCDHGKHEDLMHCLKREVREESGLIIEPRFMIDSFQYLADNGTRLTTQINYLCYMKNQDQKVKLSKEHSEYKWISNVGEAELLVVPDMKRTIAKVLHPDRQIVNYNTGYEILTQGGSNVSHVEENINKIFRSDLSEAKKLIDRILVEDEEEAEPREADSGENENEIETGDKPDNPLKTMKDLHDEVTESVTLIKDFQNLEDRLKLIKSFFKE